MDSVDSFRQFHKEGRNFTWWPYSFNAKKKFGLENRLYIYFKIPATEVKKCFILSEIKGPDHSPIGIEI